MHTDESTLTVAAGIDRVGNPKPTEMELATAPFSSILSDHMFVAEYRDGSWNKGLIQSYGPIPLFPSISGLHYGISVFEGLKAYRSAEGRPLLFRPSENALRLQRSAARSAMPAVPVWLFLEGVRELVRVDQEWIPPSGAGALYIRPILFSTDPSIRVKPAEQCQFVILTFPFGTYFSTPIDVLVCENHARAFPGGTGDIKLAGNYAPGLLADQEAHEAGCAAVMWLDAQKRRYVEECGVMNVFFVIDNEVVTPPLNGTILPGITRDSVITLARDLGYRVEERPITIDELLASHTRGQLSECFGTGTAATVTHVKRIRYKDENLELPPIEERTVGPLLRRNLMGIMAGWQPDPYCWVEPI